MYLGAEDLQPGLVVIGEPRRTGRGVEVVALPSNTAYMDSSRKQRR